MYLNAFLEAFRVSDVTILFLLSLGIGLLPKLDNPIGLDDPVGVWCALELELCMLDCSGGKCVVVLCMLNWGGGKGVTVLCMLYWYGALGLDEKCMLVWNGALGLDEKCMLVWYVAHGLKEFVHD